MQKIADARGDPMSRFYNALYAGDVAGRIAVLREVGLRKYDDCAPHSRRLKWLVSRSPGLSDGEDKRSGRHSVRNLGSGWIDGGRR